MAVQDYKINYKSDFVLTINGDAGWATQFCIKFWTGMPSQAYFVGFDGVKYVNCRVGDTPTQLLVMFDDHHLPIGPLRMQIAYHTTIEEFPGSVFDEVTNARDVIVTIDGTDYQVLLDFTGEDAPELEFDLPAYANEAERIQNELQRQQNEADRIAAELQREQATAAAVQGAENVNAQLNGTTLTVTNRQGVSTSVNTKGEQGVPGPVGPEGPQGEQGVSIVDFRPVYASETATYYVITFSDGHEQSVAIPKGAKGDTGATGPTGPQGPQGQTGVSITGLVKTGETETDTLYNVTFSNGTTQAVSIPKGEKGDQGEQGPQGPQGPMGDVAVITPEQQAAFTMYSTTGQNTDGPMTQKAVTDAIESILSYEDVGINSISDSFGFIRGTTPPTWATNNSTKNSKVVPVNGAKMVNVIANASYNATLYFLTSSYTEPTASDNNQVVSSLSAIDGSRHNLPAGESGTFIIPDDCAYIVFNVRSDNVSNYTPSMVELGYVLSDLMTEETGSSVTKIMSQNAVTKNIMAEEEINLSSLPIINCYMYTNGGNPTWQNGTANNDGVFIPVEPNCLYEVTGCLTGYGSPRFAFLKDNTHVTGRITNFATGWTNYQGVGVGVSKRYIAPSDAHYLFCNESSGSTQMLFSSVKKLTLAKDVAGENKQGIDFINEFPDYIIKNPIPVIFGEQNKGSLGANKSWTTTGGHRVVPVSEGEIFIIKGNRFYGWLTDTYTPPTGTSPTPYVNGHDRVRLGGNTVIDTAPTGASYLVISTIDGSGNPSSPWEVYKIDSYEERIQKFVKVRFGSWNVGQYRYVDCAYPNPVLDYLPVGTTVTHDVSAADADAVSLRFRKICNQANVDILGMCEYRPLYSESNLVAKDVLWQCYGNIYEGSTTGANNNTVAFNGLKYVTNEEIRYSSQISGGTRYYKHVTANLAGKEIHIVETHFEHSYPTKRTAQMQQLITAMSSYEYVIIGGDFNTNLANTTEEEILQELAMFTDAGYKLANGGYLGRFMTHDEGHKIDNIAAKGFAMNNIQVIQEAGTLSDHWLIYCDLTLL